MKAVFHTTYLSLFISLATVVDTQSQRAVLKFPAQMLLDGNLPFSELWLGMRSSS